MFYVKEDTEYFVDTMTPQVDDSGETAANICIITTKTKNKFVLMLKELKIAGAS